MTADERLQRLANQTNHATSLIVWEVLTDLAKRLNASGDHLAAEIVYEESEKWSRRVSEVVAGS